MSDPPPSPGAPDLAPVSELSYGEASRELDGIVAFFEHREVDVDLLVARLERATAIVDELDRRIRRTRMQVEELVPRLEATTRAAPGGPPEDEQSPDEHLGWESDEEVDGGEEVDGDDVEDEGVEVDDADSDQPLF